MTDVVWFDDERCQDVGCAGGKGASLARMAAESLPVPHGFVVPSEALAEAVDAERLTALARAGDHE
jgi:phosphoenolpyruvate synthase/pyruvate phosphate dikinase